MTWRFDRAKNKGFAQSHPAMIHIDFGSSLRRVRDIDRTRSTRNCHDECVCLDSSAHSPQTKRSVEFSALESCVVFAQFASSATRRATSLECRRGPGTAARRQCRKRAGDGHADTFVVQQHDNQVRITVNGKQVSDTPISQLDSINIQGSSDDDILIAEFKSGESLAGLHLLFDGKGGTDTIVLRGNEKVNSVSHDVGASGANRVDIQSSAGTATVSYANVESVNDQLVAKSRAFNFETGGQQISINDTGTPTDNISRIDVKNSAEQNELSIVFKNPTADLTVHTDANSAKPDSITLNGIDQKFHANTNIFESPDDLLTVHGPTNLGGGGLDVVAGTVNVESSLATSQASIEIHAAQQISIGESGSLQDDAGKIQIDAPVIEHDGQIVAHGGFVNLDSGDSGTTIVRGSIDVSQPVANQPAGAIQILGSQVGLFDNAQLNASATVGAGTILIGGDYQGKNPAIRNALRTYVGPNVVIRADAETVGDGGKVVVWSDEVTRFYGAIECARGLAIRRRWIHRGLRSAVARLSRKCRSAGPEG